MQWGVDKRTAAVDWERIEDQYRQGLLTLREIASAHDDLVTEGGIRKRAKRGGWERDLTAKVQAKAEALVRRAEYADGTQRPDERTLVDSAAQQVADVMLGQKAKLSKLDTIAAAQLVELESSDEDLKTRIGLARTISDTIKTLHAMQADSWGFASVPPAPESRPPMDRLELARRVAFTMRRAAEQLPAQVH